MHVSTTAIGLKMGCDRVAVASPTGFGLGLCTCVLLSVQKERRERERRERERRERERRERGVGEREGLERERGWRERGVGEREGLEREGFFPDVTLSLEAQEQATCAARPGAVSVRVKVSSSTMVVGRVQEDRGPLS
jgi:hypothetical protein